MSSQGESGAGSVSPFRNFGTRSTNVAPSHAGAIEKVILSARKAKTWASGRDTPIEHRALPRRTLPLGRNWATRNARRVDDVIDPHVRRPHLSTEFDLAEVTRDNCCPRSVMVSAAVLAGNATPCVLR